MDEFPREVTHRVVGFVDNKFGYVALGTDWTMGTGEGMYLYITHDGGNSWNNIEIPVSNSAIDDKCYNNINYIKKENEAYKISLGYAEDVCQSLIFKSTSISGPWKFIETEKTIYHYGSDI